MRKGLVLFIVINIFIITFLVHSVFTLLTLLFEDASADAISNLELPAPNSSSIIGMDQHIPKIIHQTYKNESIPAIWQGAQQSCIDLHPDYEYKLWTDDKSRDFIAKEYPWFLNTFENYEFPIQRADAIRYFVLAHYGGTYVDLDDGCNRRLDPLLQFGAWVRRTSPTGISNDAMGAIPRHPFFQRVIEQIENYDRHWVLPYITVMYSTGPLFLSVLWKEYMLTDPDELARVRILMPEHYNRNPWSFFVHHQGSSWHGKDAQLIFWMGQHWKLLTVAGFLTAGVVGLCLWWLYTRVIRLGSRRWSRVHHRYARIPSRAPSAAPTPPHSPSVSPTRIKLRNIFPNHQRNSKRDDDVETGHIERVGRHV
ncbi:hypothetical protein AJ80_08729 [Polytolypa hystricis UAMH7299]|uniref:Mannosyl phosphorylinositol ceramide synthase SUR1 n=1 Tax=Polytolypa hystricis (strain UAMH7299) TaxID=1447883 RepID=A0A2B7WUR8_POLH7|nr:hypothetical protein AJ80_08729 [Polytolypa hystricis UAMH7299]